ncbi:MAG: glutaredoxin 3 [Alphaproteobacteria bacterium]|nr:glutaredoxin 3 [Alphaproteobacteria bacterium]
MPNIEVYSSLFCPYCARAKNLLKKKGVEFTEIDVDGDPAVRIAMMERAQGRTSVPQIFLDDKLIGGSDDLVALEMSGDLDKMLQATGQ